MNNTEVAGRKSWVIAMFVSSIGRKYVMSLTGLFLCSFLVIHLIGNLLTLAPDNGVLFDEFTHFMESNIAIRILEYVLFAGFIIHILQSLVVTRMNQKARPDKYAVNPGNASSTWYSRNMGILGTIIFVFLVIHLRNFFWDLKFEPEELGTDAKGDINLYKEVIETFGLWYYVAFYVAGMVALGYHLWHGFASSFRSLGLMHSKYTPAIIFIGKLYTIVITGGFIIIPLYWYFKQL